MFLRFAMLIVSLFYPQALPPASQPNPHTFFVKKYCPTLLALNFVLPDIRLGISRNFRNARQEDAHEYMVNLLESMHKCCLPSGVPSESPGAYEKSLVHKIFGGRLRSQVIIS